MWNDTSDGKSWGSFKKGSETWKCAVGFFTNATSPWCASGLCTRFSCLTCLGVTTRSRRQAFDKIIDCLNAFCSFWLDITRGWGGGARRKHEQGQIATATFAERDEIHHDSKLSSITQNDTKEMIDCERIVLKCCVSTLTVQRLQLCVWYSQAGQAPPTVRKHACEVKRTLWIVCRCGWILRNILYLFSF